MLDVDPCVDEIAAAYKHWSPPFTCRARLLSPWFSFVCCDCIDTVPLRVDTTSPRAEAQGETEAPFPLF
jgi:hypothetical protein